jgi:hypothetical protein
MSNPQQPQPPYSDQNWFRPDGPPQQPPTQQYQWQPGGTGKPPRKSHRTRNIVLGVLGVIVLAIIIGTATSGGGSTPSASSTSNPPAVANGTTTQPAGQPSTQAAPPSPAAPAMTVSQQQAVDSAKSYIQTEPGFSYQGLIDQLDSSSGEGFSVADATFAVNYVAPASDTAFWNAQAVDSAKSYMQTEPGFSCSSLMDQLDSSAGEQFTQAQAAYAVQQVGLGSC